MEHAWDFAQVGSGGLYSNVVDMARWDAAFQAGEVGGPGFRDAMLERGILNSGDTLAYAFGLDVDEYRGLRRIAHGGALAGFRSYMLRFPDEGTSVLVLCNVTDADPGRRAHAVADRILGDRLAAAPAGESADAETDTDDDPSLTLSPDRLAGYEGLYWSEEVEAEIAVEVVDEGLVLVGPPGEVPARPVDEDVFQAGGMRIRFLRGDDDRVTAFILDAGRANGLRYERTGDA